MDRQIVYPGSIPLDTDLLYAQRNALIGLGSLTQTVLGTSPLVDGLACVPGTGHAVVIGPGSLSSQMAIDYTPYGSLPADLTPLVKTGINLGSTVLELGTSPDSSTVLCWLVQAGLQEADEGPIALPYWNASDPSVPFSGPANSGAAQNTVRRTRLVLSVKSSGPVPVGTYAPPSADPGWIGLYGVTAWVGKPGIDAEDIRGIPDAPILSFRLPDLSPGFSRQDLIGSDRSWQVPPGVRQVRVRVVAGGGGGGGGTLGFGGGGGGAGGYAEAIVPVQSGQLIPIVVGGGGTPAPPNVTGGPGGSSSFGNAVVATGGAGGASSNPDSHGGAGGVGLAGQLLIQGGMGGDGPTIGGVPAGNGGASTFGGGGRGSNQGGTPADGKAPGSGAGGAYGNNATGGHGAPGLVVIEY